MPATRYLSAFAGDGVRTTSLKNSGAARYCALCMTASS